MTPFRLARTIAAGSSTVRRIALAILIGCLPTGAGVIASAVSPAAAAPSEPRCDLAHAQTNACRKVGQRKKAADRHPALESGGTMPATANVMPLLHPGAFRLDMSTFYATYPIFGLGNVRGSPSSSLLGTVTLGYGVNDRLTVFGSVSESNNFQSNGGFQPEFVDPRVGIVYRVANPAKFWGNALDFVGDLTANAPLAGPVSSSGPYGDLGPIARGRFLVTREFGHGFTLQLNGGFQAAVVTTYPYGGLPSRTGEVDAIFGIAGQYRLSQLSNRLYVNGELGVLKPLTNDNVQIYASPFRTADVYSATLGASYVVKPGVLVARVSDTVALNVVNGNNLFPPVGGGPRHFVSNTVGLTLSFVNLQPENWLHALTHH